jgi:hypothetical protein
VPRSAEACPNCGYRQLRGGARFSESRKRKINRCRRHTFDTALRLFHDLIVKSCAVEEALELVKAVTGFRLTPGEVEAIPLAEVKSR